MNSKRRNQIVWSTLSTLHKIASSADHNHRGYINHICFSKITCIEHKKFGLSYFSMHGLNPGFSENAGYRRNNCWINKFYKSLSTNECACHFTAPHQWVHIIMYLFNNLFIIQQTSSHSTGGSKFSCWKWKLDTKLYNNELLKKWRIMA